MSKSAMHLATPELEANDESVAIAASCVQLLGSGWGYVSD